MRLPLGSVFFIPWNDVLIESQPVLVPDPGKKSIDQLAVEVLAGIWGNGVIRNMKLTSAGYDYLTVQQRVNEIAEARKQSGKTHVVVKNDTLSKIAKMYGTTVKALVEANGIKNANVIYVGQEIKIV